MLEPITTAEAFAKARSALGLKQRELAEVLGLHLQTVSKYERGAWSIDRRTSWALVGLLCAKTHGAPNAEAGEDA